MKVVDLIGLLVTLYLCVYPFKGKKWFFVKRLGHFKIKQGRFVLIIRTLLLAILYASYAGYYLYSLNTSNNWLSVLNVSVKLPVAISILSIAVVIINLFLNNKKDSEAAKTQQFFKLIDIISNKLNDKNFTDKLDNNFDQLITTQRKFNRRLEDFIFVKYSNQHSYFGILIRLKILKMRLFVCYNLCKKRTLTSTEYENGKELISVLDVRPNFNILESKRGLRTTRQYNLLAIICYKLIMDSKFNFPCWLESLIIQEFNNNDKLNNLYKNYFDEPGVYDLLTKAGYINKIRSLFPKTNNDIERPNYLHTYANINYIFNKPVFTNTSMLCRLIHRTVKLINSMDISIDEKFYYFGLVRSLLSDRILMLVFYNATYSFRGIGLAKQLMGSCFFGNVSELTGITFQHFNLKLIPTEDRKISKRIAMYYYAGRFFPSSVSKKFITYRLIKSVFNPSRFYK